MGTNKRECEEMEGKREQHSTGRERKTNKGKSVKKGKKERESNGKQFKFLAKEKESIGKGKNISWRKEKYPILFHFPAKDMISTYLISFL